MYNCIFILGPTASGKTKVSIEIAKKLNTEIINADSIQIYQHLNIGSAKADTQEQESIKHHLLDFVNPTDNFSVSQYRELAMPIIKNLIDSNKVPVIVGGTGFYVDSLINDYDYGNSIKDDNLRAELSQFVKDNGNLALHNILKELDDVSANNIHFNNVQRVIRAIEIVKLTGIKKSMQDTMQSKKNSVLKPLIIVLNWEREVLYNRINQRVDIMIDNGLLEEVDNLMKTFNLSKANQSFQGIGYKEIYDYLINQVSLEEAKETLKQNTRNYAKRQITWFKRVEDAVWFNLSETSLQNVVDFAVSKLKK